MNTKTTLFTIRGDYFQFGSVFIKNNNQTEIKKKNQNRFKPTGFGSVRFFRTKTGFARFFGLARFFPVWLGFFSLDSVRFFQFQTYKTETKPNRPVF